jgi:hypothetical protein
MQAKRYGVTFKPRDVACIPPCGMAAALQFLDETIRNLLSRYADASIGETLRIGRCEVTITNGVVTLHQGDATDAERVVALLKQYFNVHELSAT